MKTTRFKSALFFSLFLIQIFTIPVFASDQTAEDYVRKGMLSLRQNQTKEALVFFRKAKSLDPEFAPAFVGEAEILMIQNAWDESLALLNRAVELAPKFGVAYHNRGILQYYRREYKLAYADLRKAALLGESVEKDILFQVWGAAFPEDMIEKMSEQISTNPKDADAYLNRGIAYFHKQDWQATLSDWKRAQQLGAVIDPVMWKELESKIKEGKSEHPPVS